MQRDEMKVFCQNIIINKLNFERNMRDVDNDGIIFKVSPALSQKRDETEKNVKLEARIIVGEKGKSSFFCEMNIISILTWDGITDNFEFNIINKGMEYIMSFARVKIFELCHQAGINPIYLPELTDMNS